MVAYSSHNIIGCFAVDREFTYIFFGPGQMEANGCVQRLDLAEIFTMSMFKFEKDVKSGSIVRKYV